MGHVLFQFHLMSSRGRTENLEKDKKAKCEVNRAQSNGLETRHLLAEVKIAVSDQEPRLMNFITSGCPRFQLCYFTKRRNNSIKKPTLLFEG